MRELPGDLDAVPIEQHSPSAVRAKRKNNTIRADRIVAPRCRFSVKCRHSTPNAKAISRISSGHHAEQSPVSQRPCSLSPNDDNCGFLTAPKSAHGHRQVIVDGVPFIAETVFKG